MERHRTRGHVFVRILLCKLHANTARASNVFFEYWTGNLIFFQFFAETFFAD